MKLSTLLLPLALLSATSMANYHIPGKDQARPILLKNGTIHTVSQGTLKNADLLFSQGKITAVGTVKSVPDNAQIIDVSGKHIYPGLIALNTSIGLAEIGSIKATKDAREIGEVNPDIKARVAFNADSQLIPTIRSNGVTHTQIVPEGRMLTGQSSLMQLDGWNWQKSLVKADDALHLNWPRLAINTAWWEKRSPKEQRKQSRKTFKRMEGYFESAKHYYDGVKAGKKLPVDSRWHSMIKLFDNKLPLHIHADEKRQIAQALIFAKKHNFNIVIVGGRDAWRLTDQLREQNVSVIYQSPMGLPGRQDEDHDQAYKTPKMLADAGVDFALALSGNWKVRSLPFAAGQAINYGLTMNQALASVTLTPAKILGLDKTMGSIEVGKQANIVISKGDIFDYLGHKVETMFIDGRKIDLNDRHKSLYNKFRQKTE